MWLCVKLKYSHSGGAVGRLGEAAASLDVGGDVPVVHIRVRHSPTRHQLPHQHSQRPLPHCTMALNKGLLHLFHFLYSIQLDVDFSTIISGILILLITDHDDGVSMSSSNKLMSVI